MLVSGEDRYAKDGAMKRNISMTPIGRLALDASGATG
jgi:hypothetical protein